MENIIVVAIAIVVALLLIKFLWNSFRGLVQILLTIIIVFVVLYYTKPEVLDNWLGEDTVNKIEIVVEKNTETLKEIGGDVVDELNDQLSEEDSLKNDE